MSDETIISISVGVVLIILNLLVRAYVDPIMPEKKKAISFIKKFLSFNLKYILPIIFLIYIFIDFEFNKYFILLFCLVFGILLFNIVFEYENYIYRKRKLKEKSTIVQMAEFYEKLNNKKTTNANTV
jgi:hypothetical protein